MDKPNPELVRLADYAPPPYQVDSVELDVELDPVRTIVRNRMRIRRAPGAAADAPLRLDGVNLSLLRLELDGEALSPNRVVADEDGLAISDPPQDFWLEVETAVAPRENKSRSGLLEVGGKLMTQCEAQGFRKLTYFPDRPDVLARYTVTLHADAAAYPVLLSNGNLVGEGPEAGGRHWARWEDPFPKPSYIFAIVAGAFGRLEDRHVTASGRPVRLAIYADPPLVAQCRFAMDSLKRALAWDERAYGLEYDLDLFNIVAVTGWSGAMENKGLNLFGANGVIADPQIATDEDFIVIERIIGHEAFHNWTGNRVTCRDWFQLCLKEGLTRFRDQHFIEDKMASGVWRIESVRALRRNQFPEDDGPAAHPVQPAAYAEIDNFYTNTIYDKGAEIVRMLRTLLGPGTFRRGFDLYIARNDGQAVTLEALVAAMEAASGRDLGQFRRWSQQAGRPRVRARGAYDPSRRSYRLTLSQACAPTPGQPQKPAFHVPVAIGLLSEAGETLSFRLGAEAPAREAVLELTEPEQTFVLEDVEGPPIPSLLRGFSAPVTLEAELEDDALATLMVFDPDPFARWDAAQTLTVRLVRSLAADHGDQALASGGAAPPEPFLAAVGAVLEAEGDDALLRSLILTLPDEPVLSEGLARVDLDGHMAARNFLRRAIAARYGARLRALYERLAETGPYAPDVAGVGRRRLKAAVLDLIAADPAGEGAALAFRQLTTAQNMTDAFEALCLLAHLDAPERREGMAWFYERWKDTPTVIDKWFNAQALSRATGAVDDIIALERHPAYDKSSYAQASLYYGGFFRQNRVAFHDPSGKGYAFLAERLLEMDRMGRSGSHYLMPQINQWRRYDPHRQALMRAALERVAATPGLSKGLRENVARALAEEGQ